METSNLFQFYSFTKQKRIARQDDIFWKINCPQGHFALFQALPALSAPSYILGNRLLYDAVILSNSYFVSRSLKSEINGFRIKKRKQKFSHITPSGNMRHPLHYSYERLDIFHPLSCLLVLSRWLVLSCPRNGSKFTMGKHAKITIFPKDQESARGVLPL